MNWNGLELPEAYYQDESVYIIHGDCREVLPLLPTGSIDLVMTDPPYNVGKDYGTYKDKLKPKDYWALASWVKEQSDRIGGGNFVLVLGSYGDLLREWWNLVPEGKLIIVKMGAKSKNNVKHLSLQYHAVLTTVRSSKGMSDLWEDIRWPGEGYFFNEPRYGHPAMTPEKLARRLAYLFSPDDGIIVDPFLGVGTMAIGAKVMGRKCIGIELEERFCAIAAKRCSQSIMRLSSKEEKCESSTIPSISLL